MKEEGQERKTVFRKGAQSSARVAMPGTGGGLGWADLIFLRRLCGCALEDVQKFMARSRTARPMVWPKGIHMDNGYVYEADEPLVPCLCWMQQAPCSLWCYK